MLLSSTAAFPSSNPPLHHAKDMPWKYSLSSSPHKTFPLLPNSLPFFQAVIWMKFGKTLKQQKQETLPDWRDKFLSYKDLKKLVKLMSSPPPPNLLTGSSDQYVKAEADFIYLLNSEIDKFNSFFMEQEEDFVIRHKELQHRIERVVDRWGTNGRESSSTVFKEEMAKIKVDIVNFHGEMILLMNYSNFNYTGLAKILKKYDKRTGGLLRSPFIQKVLHQPFFTTDLISKLVKECESMIDAVFPVLQEEEKGKLVEDRELITVSGEGVFRSTVAALLTMKEMRIRGSSTFGRFSLPPLVLPEPDLLPPPLHLNSPIHIP